MIHFLRSRRFNKQELVEAWMKEFFNLKDKNWCQSEIKELAKKWLQPDYHPNLACYRIIKKTSYQNIAKLLVHPSNFIKLV